MLWPPSPFAVADVVVAVAAAATRPIAGQGKKQNLSRARFLHACACAVCAVSIRVVTILNIVPLILYHSLKKSAVFSSLPLRGFCFWFFVFFSRFHSTTPLTIFLLLLSVFFVWFEINVRFALHLFMCACMLGIGNRILIQIFQHSMMRMCSQHRIHKTHIQTHAHADHIAFIMKSYMNFYSTCSPLHRIHLFNIRCDGTEYSE